MNSYKYDKDYKSLIIISCLIYMCILKKAVIFVLNFTKHYNLKNQIIMFLIINCFDGFRFLRMDYEDIQYVVAKKTHFS